jgi:RecB family exonuclease
MIDHLSPSSISTFKQCPLKFKLSRLERREEPPTEAQLVGNFVHEGLALMMELPAADRQIERVRVIMGLLWRSVVNEDDKTWEQQLAGVGADPRKAMRAAWNCIENYFGMEDPTTFTPGGVEQEINLAPRGVPMKVFIDLWAYRPTLTVTDYKTGKVPGPKWRDGKFEQLYIYAILLEMLLDETPTHVELLYLRDGTRLRRPVQKRDLDATLRLLTETHAEICERMEIDDFPPTPNRLCDWCSFKPICPAHQAT